MNVVLQSLAYLWKASGDESLPTALASILGMTPAEVEKDLRSRLEDKPETTSS